MPDIRWEQVSILTRSFIRVLLIRDAGEFVFLTGFNPHPEFYPGAIKSFENFAISAFRFQSSPGVLSGCYLDLSGTIEKYRKFQSSPGVLSGCYLKPCFKGDYNTCFNPHPEFYPGAICCNYLLTFPILGFNPHPEFYPGAIKTNSLYFLIFQVSILTRSFIRVLYKIIVDKIIETIVSILTRSFIRVLWRVMTEKLVEVFVSILTRSFIRVLF